MVNGLHSGPRLRALWSAGLFRRSVSQRRVLLRVCAGCRRRRVGPARCFFRAGRLWAGAAAAMVRCDCSYGFIAATARPSGRAAASLWPLVSRIPFFLWPLVSRLCFFPWPLVSRFTFSLWPFVGRFTFSLWPFVSRFTFSLWPFVGRLPFFLWPFVSRLSVFRFDFRLTCVCPALHCIGFFASKFAGFSSPGNQGRGWR